MVFSHSANSVHDKPRNQRSRTEVRKLIQQFDPRSLIWCIGLLLPNSHRTAVALHACRQAELDSAHNQIARLECEVGDAGMTAAAEIEALQAQCAYSEMEVETLKASAEYTQREMQRLQVS